MLSKYYNILLAVVLFFTLGCGLKLGEKNKTANVLEIKGASCLDQSLGKLKLFFAGDATDEQVSDSFMCLQDVLLTFKDKVRGKEMDSYTPAEIAGYLAKKFASEGGGGLSTGLLVEIMKLKVILVGGGSDKLTKNEIQALSSIIARLKNDVVKLNPHMRIIVSKWKPEVASEMKEKKFLEAKAAFEGFLNRVALLLASSGNPYELNSLLNLAIEAIKGSPTSGGTVKLINNARNFVIKFKMTLIGGSEALTGKEWVPFAKTVGEVFFQALRFKYFANELTDEQVAEKFKVYEQVGKDVSNLLADLLIFKSVTLLKNTEIVDLLEAAKPLLPSLNVNGELVNQIGKVKVMLLGNHEDGKGALAWSTNDFKNLSLKLPALLKNAGVIAANLKHLKTNKTGFRKNEIKYEDFNNAELLAHAAVNEISLLIQDNYDLNDLRALAVNLSETLLKDKFKLPENFAVLMEVAKSAKHTLTGDAGTLLTKQNIHLLLNVGIHGYTNYVEFVNFVGVFVLEEKEFAAAFGKVFSKIKATLALELQLKASHMITAAEISQLVLTAQTQKLLKSKFDQKSLDSLFKGLFENVLNPPENRFAKKVLPGFNSQALQAVSEELHLWIANQLVIASVFENKVEYTKADLLGELTKKSRAAHIDELTKVVAVPGLMNFNDKGYLKILTETNGLYHVKDLNNTNLTRSLSRVLIRAYANDLDRATKLGGVLLEEAQFAFDQLKDFIVSLDLVSADNTTFISSRFRESNLFLGPSNGDTTASFEEINHLILHIISGKQRAATVGTVAMQKCLKVPNDLNSLNEVGQNCLLDVYFNEENAFSDMPGFAKMKIDKDDKGELKITPEQNKTYYLSLLKAAGYIPNDKVPEEERTIKMGDANLFPHVVQYVEMIFFSYDTNHDGYLQKDEGIKAFPTFAEVMKPVQKQFSLNDKEMIGLFVWLLKKGTVFPINNMKKFAKDHECNLNNDSKTCTQDWTVNASRVDIGKIFNLIAMLTAPKPPPPPDAVPSPTPGP